MNEEFFFARNHCLKEPVVEKTSLLGSVRNYILEKFGIWDFFDLLPYRWTLYYYDFIKPIFKPSNQKIRKFIPRQYKDVSHLMVEVNFEFIKIFYQDEYKADIVDWSATEHHKEFAEWLEKAYSYITVDRIQLQKDLEAAYPISKSLEEMFRPIEDEQGRKMFEMVQDDVPYHVKYAEVNRIEELIEKKDTELLIDFVNRREYFWT